MSRLLRAATWIYGAMMLLVVVVAATVRTYELPVVLTVVPVLWLCTRLAEEGRLAALPLGAVAVPLWWWEALQWFPGTFSGHRADLVLVFELGIVPLAALGLGVAALGLVLARLVRERPHAVARASWWLGAGAGVGVGLRLVHAIGPVGLMWLVMIGAFRLVLGSQPR